MDPPRCYLCDQREVHSFLFPLDRSGAELFVCKPCLWINTCEEGGSRAAVSGIHNAAHRIYTDGQRHFAIRDPPRSVAQTLKAWKEEDVFRHGDAPEPSLSPVGPAHRPSYLGEPTARDNAGPRD